MSVTRMQSPIHWFKCKGDVWCSLANLDLSTVTENGVYIIWASDENGAFVVRVGQGDIADRLSDHRNDETIAQYTASGGTLYVTWANLSQVHRNGVERFLFDKLEPAEGKRAPDVDPIQVNLPW